MAKRQRDVVSIRGPAHLCYVALDDSEDNHAFQGHVVDSASGSCFGLMATQVARKNPLDCCCQADDPPLWFKFTIIDYKNNKETQRIVEKTGGDYIILASQEINFNTDSLKTGKQAELHMKKYNPKLLDYEAIVCIGGIAINENMVVTELDFEEKCSDELICSHHHDDIPIQNQDKRPKSHDNREGDSHDATTSAPNDEIVEKSVPVVKETSDVNENVVDNDDDFGFEEFKDVKLIKIGLSEEVK